MVKCKRKMQKRRDILTILGMLVLLTFILRMWPILLLMLIGVFFYAMWLLFHMGEKPKQTETTPRLALPSLFSSAESPSKCCFGIPMPDGCGVSQMPESGLPVVVN